MREKRFDCFKYLRRALLLIFLIFNSFTVISDQPCLGNHISFAPGETVYYDAFYNWRFVWLRAGNVTFTLEESQWRGDPAWHIKAKGITRSAYDRLFRVRDSFEVYIDTLSLEPFEFNRYTNEGGYTAHHHYIFNREDSVVNARISKREAPYEESSFEWPDCSFDMLSMIYQARNIDFSKYDMNDKIPISILVDGEFYDLYIRYLGRGIAETRNGRRFYCLKFSPMLVEGTIFEEGEGMTVWVTDDKNRVPILVESDILVGSVKAVFRDAEGLRYPLSSEIK
ncbi:DUF3108 domain-containing protein [Marinilabiliaceae bacterium ANBcel2]|nr:DUF3108 domain-containing protein [Marinilabiliaceae bacterium ANBcel2]